MSETLRNILIGIGIVLTVILLVFLFIPKSKTLNINELYWEYTVCFETLETHYDEGWSVPYNGDVYQVVERFYDTDSEFKGYDEDGNAIYDEVDVYKDYYYYTVTDWEVTRKEVTKGTIDEEPYWGSEECNYGERLGKHVKDYYASVTENRQSKYYSVSYDNWIKLQRNEPNKVKVSLDYITEIE